MIHIPLPKLSNFYPAAGSSSGKHIFEPEVEVMIMTWLAFFVLLFILSKFFWRPLLNTAEAREKKIKESLEQAELTRKEYENLAEHRKKTLKETETAATEFFERTKNNAIKTARAIEDQAKESAMIEIENAKREITALEENSAVYLREKSAETAVALAEKILNEKLDTAQHQKLINKMIDEL